MAPGTTSPPAEALPWRTSPPRSTQRSYPSRPRLPSPSRSLGSCSEIGPSRPGVRTSASAFAERWGPHRSRRGAPAAPLARGRCSAGVSRSSSPLARSSAAGSAAVAARARSPRSVPVPLKSFAVQVGCQSRAKWLRGAAGGAAGGGGGFGPAPSSGRQWRAHTSALVPSTSSSPLSPLHPAAAAVTRAPSRSSLRLPYGSAHLTHTPVGRISNE